MANPCDTKFIFKGNIEEIKTLYNTIKKCISKVYAKNDWNKSWLGNVLYGVGLGDLIDNPDLNIGVRCRGEIIDIGEIEENNDTAFFDLYTETAWVPMGKMWERIIKKLELKTVWFEFIADEVYEIYDPKNYGDFTDKYYLDACESNEYISEFFDSDESLITFVNEQYEQDFKTVQEVTDFADEYNNNAYEDEYLFIHEYTYVQDLYD